MPGMRIGQLRRGLAAGIALAGAALLMATAGPAAAAGDGYGRTISFSGQTWRVKTSTSPVGPGPNVFSDNSGNVWVDGGGRLHLRIERRRGTWYSAEVVSTRSFGYGTYRWYLDTPVDNLDVNAVLGMFTWNDDPAYTHRELDIEFARWGNPTYGNAQYTVQPWDVPGNQYVFGEPAGLTQTVHSLTWRSDSVLFQSVRGPSAGGAPIAGHTFSQGIPQAGGENARMNLWLFNGKPPANGRAVEVVIRRFEFVPAT
jgi:hypothetical protein